MQRDEIKDSIFSKYFLFSDFPISSKKTPEIPKRISDKGKLVSFLTIKLQSLCQKNIFTRLSSSADVRATPASPCQPLPVPPPESDTCERGQTAAATMEKGFTLQNKVRSDRSVLLLEFSGSKTFSLSLKCYF